MMEFFHLRPMHFGPEMVFGMVAIVKKKPIVKLMVRAYTPGDRLVWIAPVMEKITIKVRATVPQIIEWQEKEKKFPV